jgi:hypothetical protein
MISPDVSLTAVQIQALVVEHYEEALEALGLKG